MGLAALRVRDLACDPRRVHRELRARAPRGRAATSRYAAWFERMNGEICLSCQEIERYVGEEEERVHGLRGVSLDLEPGSIPAGAGAVVWGLGMLLDFRLF